MKYKEEYIVHVLQEGPTRLLVKYEKNTTTIPLPHDVPISIPINSYLTKRYYINRGKRTKGLGVSAFIDDCSIIFHDCVSLLDKIKNKELKYGDIDVIVKYANENCLNTNYE